MAYPPMTAAIEQRACRLYTAGCSLRETATELGLSHQGVRKALQRNGVATRPTGGATHPIPGVTGLYDLWRKWGSWRAVAEVLGVSQRTIFRHLDGTRGASAQVVP